MPQPDNSISASLPAVLNGLAAEMDELVSHGLKLESSIAALAARTHVRGEMIENLQSLDLLLQHLSDLREFMLTLAEDANETNDVGIERALDALKLRAVHFRLLESINGVPSGYVCALAGEVEML